MPISEEYSGTGANPAQRVGIALSYAKRYSLLLIAGLSPEDEDQDGGEGNLKRPTEAEVMPKAKPPATSPQPTPTRAQAPLESTIPPGPLSPIGPAEDNALQAEARAREQAEAKSEKPSTPPPQAAPKPNGQAVNRPAIFQKVRDAARKKGVKEAQLLKELTGHTSMAELDNDGCLALEKALVA